MRFYHDPSQQKETLIENNRGWKAYEREGIKTMEIVATIASCVASNRDLKQSKDAARHVRAR